MKATIIVFLLLISHFSYAQIQIERSVIASHGASVSGDLTIDATLGQSAIGISDDNTITIGFHQVNLLTTHVDKNATVQLNVHPNPTSDRITIQSETAIVKIDLIDISGKIFKSMEHPTQVDKSIDLSGIPEGPYLLIIETSDHEIHHHKIVVIR